MHRDFPGVGRMSHSCSCVPLQRVICSSAVKLSDTRYFQAIAYLKNTDINEVCNLYRVSLQAAHLLSQNFTFSCGSSSQPLLIALTFYSLLSFTSFNTISPLTPSCALVSITTMRNTYKQSSKFRDTEEYILTTGHEDLCTSSASHRKLARNMHLGSKACKVQLKMVWGMSEANCICWSFEQQL